MNGVERGRVAFIPSMHDQWAVGRSPFEKLLTMGSVPDSPTARSAGGLPKAGQIMIFRPPDECLRCMVPSCCACGRPVLECAHQAHFGGVLDVCDGPIRSEVCAMDGPLRRCAHHELEQGASK